MLIKLLKFWSLYKPMHAYAWSASMHKASICSLPHFMPKQGSIFFIVHASAMCMHTYSLTNTHPGTPPLTHTHLSLTHTQSWQLPANKGVVLVHYYVRSIHPYICKLSPGTLLLSPISSCAHILICGCGRWGKAMQQSSMFCWII